MSIQSRLKSLEKNLHESETADGFCHACRDRHIALHYDAPIPEPCQLCGKVAKSVVYISRPNECHDEHNLDALSGRCQTLLILPDNGRLRG